IRRTLLIRPCLHLVYEQPKNPCATPLHFAATLAERVIRYTPCNRFDFTMPSSPRKLFTIGHSTRTLEEFLTILATHQIKLLVDVRTVPRSRRVPQFNTDNLSEFLPRHHIQYLHLPTLAG